VLIFPIEFATLRTRRRPGIKSRKRQTEDDDAMKKSSSSRVSNKRGGRCIERRTSASLFLLLRFFFFFFFFSGRTNRLVFVDAEEEVSFVPRAPKTNYFSSSSSNSSSSSTPTPIREACEPLSVPFEDRCDYVTTTPSCSIENQSFINYPKVYYCAAKGGNVLSALFALLLISLFFHVLATVAECFFCPALAKISVYLKLRDDVAGATLLAFGNGAPDIFAQIAALNDLSSNEETDGIPLALGAVLGAGMFIAFVVFPSVVLAAPESNLNARRLRSGRRVGGYVEVDKTAFMRDCGFYCLGVMALVRCIVVGEVTFRNSMQLFALYALYVTNVLLPEGWNARGVGGGLAERLAALRREPSASARSLENNNNSNNVLDDIAEEEEEGEEEDNGDSENSDADAEVGLLVDEDEDGEEEDNDDNDSSSASEISSETPFDDELSDGGDDDDDDDDDDGSILHHPWERGWRRSRLYDARNGESLWKQCWLAFTSIASFPVFIVREILKFTMPELGFNGRRVRRWQTSALPICAPLFFVWAEKMYPGTIHTGGIVYGGIVATAFSAIIFTAWPHLMPDNYAVTRRSRSARRRAPTTNYPTTTSNPASRLFSGMLTIVAFLVSMVWMDVVAGEVVSLLTAAGKICGISEALLGATVLAWGNSVGDFIANRTIARDGRPKMAVAACFAGPTMNVLLGTAAGLAFRTFSSGDMKNIRAANELLVLFAFLICGLLFLLFAAPFLWRWRVGKKQSYAMMGYYAVFAVLYALTSTGEIFKTPWVRSE
jgi:sodium/potassium/calcium exchanger 6